MTYHIPVLLEEVLAYLDPKKGDIILDGTLGGGGYARNILERFPAINKIVGIDQDKDALTYVKSTLQSKKIQYIHGNFSDYRDLLSDESHPFFNKVILDLGVSSYQIDTPERGFAYGLEGPLDMRMNRDQDLTAEAILRNYSEKGLADVIQNYGEEFAAKAIARMIVERRRKEPFVTTFDLVHFLKGFIRGGYERKMSAVKRVFQALRIEVNGELSILRTTLMRMAEDLPSGGRIVVITFHSLEDRIVKQTFQELVSAPSANGENIIKLNKKPIIAGDQELKANKRSASAKLRAIQKL